MFFLRVRECCFAGRGHAIKNSLKTAIHRGSSSSWTCSCGNIFIKRQRGIHIPYMYRKRHCEGGTDEAVMGEFNQFNVHIIEHRQHEHYSIQSACSRLKLSVQFPINCAECQCGFLDSSSIERSYMVLKLVLFSNQSHVFFPQFIPATARMHKMRSKYGSVTFSYKKYTKTGTKTWRDHISYEIRNRLIL